MKSRPVIAAAVVCATLGLVAAGGSAASGPTARQVATTMRRLERAPDLWATINVCRRAGVHAADVGIRGQMPVPAFAVRLQMTFRGDYYAAKRSTFVAVSGSQDTVDLGVATGGTVQGGASYTFTAPVTARGTVTFRWLRDGRLIGTATRLTTAGHRKAQYASPPHYSAASCTVS